MSDFWPYESCPGCIGAAQPGTVALLKYLLDHFPGTRSLGVYNCRDQRGSTILSIHACGRAGDDGIPLKGGEADTSLGDPIVRLLIEFANDLGIMGIIWNRVRYDAKTPRGRVYTGLVPHKDHIHFEQVSSLAASLTYSDIEEIMVTRDSKADDGSPTFAAQLAKMIEAGVMTTHTQPGGVTFNDELAVFLDRFEKHLVNTYGLGASVAGLTSEQVKAIVNGSQIVAPD